MSPWYWKITALGSSLLVLWALSAQAQDITTGLVGWWQMDAGSGTNVDDTSPGGIAPGTHDGTRAATTGDGPDWQAGWIGPGSLLFIPANLDRVTVPHHADFNITGAITISAWVNRGATAAGNTIIAKTNGSQYDWDLYLDQTTSKATFYADSICTSGVGGTTAVSADTWHHIVAVRSAATVTYYLNNASDGTATCTTGSMLVRTHPVLIGSGGIALAGSYLNGSLDDVFVYNRALLAADVTALFARGAVPPSATRRIIISTLQGPRPWQRPGKYKMTSVLPWLHLLGLLGRETPRW